MHRVLLSLALATGCTDETPCHNENELGDAIDGTCVAYEISAGGAQFDRLELFVSIEEVSNPQPISTPSGAPATPELHVLLRDTAVTMTTFSQLHGSFTGESAWNFYPYVSAAAAVGFLGDQRVGADVHELVDAEADTGNSYYRAPLELSASRNAELFGTPGDDACLRIVSASGVTYYFVRYKDYECDGT